MTHTAPPANWKTNAALWAATAALFTFAGAHMLDLVKADSEQSTQIRINTLRLDKLEMIADANVQARERLLMAEAQNKIDHDAIKQMIGNVESELLKHEQAEQMRGRRK